VLLITTATSPPKDICVLEMTDISKRTITAKVAVFFWGGLGGLKNCNRRCYGANIT